MHFLAAVTKENSWEYFTKQLRNYIAGFIYTEQTYISDVTDATTADTVSPQDVAVNHVSGFHISFGSVDCSST